MRRLQVVNRPGLQQRAVSRNQPGDNSVNQDLFMPHFEHAHICHVTDSFAFVIIALTEASFIDYSHCIFYSIYIIYGDQGFLLLTKL